MDAAPLIDPQSTELLIGDDYAVPSDQDEWRALGECIGSHENLEDLEFWDVISTSENLEALLTGVNQNRTVRRLHFHDCHGEWPLGILEIFFQSNQNLSTLVVENCCEGVITSLSAALRGCTSRSFEHILCVGFQMGDDTITEIMQALAGLPQLKRLLFHRCSFGPMGCGEVAALLQRPACVLEKIDLDNCGIGDGDLALLEPVVATSSTLTELSLNGMNCSTAALQSFSRVLKSPTCMLDWFFLFENNFGDDEMISFADALATNRTLEILGLDDDHTISDIGFAAMTRTLCNTSSIGDVYSSNHVLESLGTFEKMPYDLSGYLSMNGRHCSENTSLVAREKIFMHFFQGDFSMEPFHENAMAPKILSHLLAWIGGMPDGESFTALFNFLKKMPSLCGNCCPTLRHSGMKRKVGN